MNSYASVPYLEQPSTFSSARVTIPVAIATITTTAAAAAAAAAAATLNLFLGLDFRLPVRTPLPDINHFTSVTHTKKWFIVPVRMK